MSKYTLLIFDADETLFDYSRGQAYALGKSLTEAGVAFDPHYHITLYQRINDKLWEDFESGRIDRDTLRSERFKQVLNELDYDDCDPAVVNANYLKHLGEAGFMIDGAESLLDDMHDTYRLALLTNGFAQVQRSRISRTNTARFFDAIVISEEVGCRKPEAAIFDLLLNKLGHSDRRSVLMIGDSLRSDIRGGMNAGVDTCWYNPGGLPCPEDTTPTYIVDGFDGIREIVRG
jgi:2-haloacid dehalogenase